MPHHDLHAAGGTQMFGQLLCQVDGAMLASGAAKRYHQVLEATALIGADARIHQRHHARQKLMHALLLAQIFDDRRISAAERLESFLASGIRKAAAIEYESAAMAGFVLGQAVMK